MIITSSRVSIFGAAVEPCTPSQWIWVSTTLISVESTTVTAKILKIGSR